MADSIQLLPDHVANQIAAGEVVQRPASVVKELLENAIDAGASDIKLVIKEAGKVLIQVVDNGQGMSVTDARMCFERHATSKIRKAEDLFDLHTKGFRGEALASIAAVAHVELKTKEDQHELGTHLIIEGSKVISQEATVLPTGSSFSVKNLFFNIPARRNFLKSDNIELRHIIDEFQRVALVHHTIYFTMYHNGSEVFNLPSSNSRQRIVNVFGGKTNEKLVPIEEQTDIVKLTGFVGKPEFAKKSRSEQFFFVNNRFIKSGYLQHAVSNAFDGLLNNGQQPNYFLFLDVPPHTIDINIHPTKTEIKFDDEKAIYAILRAAIKHSLGQFNVMPVMDFEADNNLQTPYDYSRKEAVSPTIQVDSNYNPFDSSSTAKSKANSFSHRIPKPTASWESLYVGTKADDVFDFKPEVEAELVTGSLFNSEEVEDKTTVTYQIQRKYIITPVKSGLLAIHQYRAHQRVLYEQFLKAITVQKAVSQTLLFPLQLRFSKNEITLLKEVFDALENTGFRIAILNETDLEVSSMPTGFNEKELTAVLNDVLQSLEQDTFEDSFSLNDKLAKTMAQSVAIKTGIALNNREQENLVNSLFACKEPDYSPKRKPTFITITGDELDHKFS